MKILDNFMIANGKECDCMLWSYVGKMKILDYFMIAHGKESA